MALTDKLAAIADAIRAKTGGTAKLSLAQMPSEIAGIQTGPANCMRQTVQVTVAASVTESVNHVVLLPANEALAAARGLGTLVVSATSDATAAGSIVSTYATGADVRAAFFGKESANYDIRQSMLRINENGVKSSSYIEDAPDDTSNLTHGNGRLVIMEDGELRWYNNASSFKIRPSSVEVVAWW